MRPRRHQRPALAERRHDLADVEAIRRDDGIRYRNLGDGSLKRHGIGLRVDEAGPRVPGLAEDPPLEPACRVRRVQLVQETEHDLPGDAGVLERVVLVTGGVTGQGRELVEVAAGRRMLAVDAADHAFAGAGIDEVGEF